jgi:Na+/proline symporter
MPVTHESNGPNRVTSVALIVLTVTCLVAMATFAASAATDHFRFLYVLVCLVVVGLAGWLLRARR